MNGRMPWVTETEDYMEIHAPESHGARFFVLMLSLLPLFAPYGLLIRPAWDSYFNPFFLFAALISAGAVGVSAFFALAALAGLNTRMRFDRAKRVFTHARSAPIVPLRTRAYPIESIKELGVETQEWGDGPASYSFSVVMDDGQKFTWGSSSSREEINEIKNRVGLFLGLAPSATQPPPD